MKKGGEEMAKRLEKLEAAPDFELTDVQGKRVRLSEVYQQQPVVLVLNRGFM